MSQIPDSIWQGSFRLFGVDVKCHTLSDGRRIIEADSMHELLRAMNSMCDDGGGDAGVTPERGDVDLFARWQGGLS